MKTKSFLVKSRHGIYYLSIQRAGLTAVFRLALVTKGWQKWQHINSRPLSCQLHRSIRRHHARARAGVIAREPRIEQYVQTILNDQAARQPMAPLPGPALPMALPPPASIMTIRLYDAIKEYEQAGLAASKIKSKNMCMSTMRGLIAALGADFDMALLTDDVIEEKWVNVRLAAGIKDTTIKRDLSFVRGYVCVFA